MQRIVCITNEAFEDALSNGKTYVVLQESGSSVLVVNDKGEEKWYGKAKFGNSFQG